MSLTVPLSRVKERCGLTTSVYDTLIANLTADLLSALTYAIEGAYIADTGNVGLQATLNLGALEIICGEFLVVHRQWPGVGDAVQVGDLRITPGEIHAPNDPAGWKSQGWQRLAPYLRVPQASLVPAVVASASGKRIAGEGADE